MRGLHLTNSLTGGSSAPTPCPTRPLHLVHPCPTEPTDSEEPTFDDLVAMERSRVVGYTNTFRPSDIKDKLAFPQVYAMLANKPSLNLPDPRQDVLPDYSCTVHFEGPVFMKRERMSPYVRDPDNRPWVSLYAILSGTCLYLFHTAPTATPVRLSAFSRAPPNRLPNLSSSFLSEKPDLSTGRLFASFSLQHAEVGAALDFIPLPPRLKSKRARFSQKMSLTAKVSNPWIHRKVNPDLYDTPITHAFRLRAHTWQMVFAIPDERMMLSWVDHICRSIDISLPIEGRSEVRQRTSPRRGHRMRLLQGRISDAGVGLDMIMDTFDMLQPMLGVGPSDARLSTNQTRARTVSETELIESITHILTTMLDSQAGQANPLPQDDEYHQCSSVMKPRLKSLARQTREQELRYRKRIVPILFSDAAIINRIVLDTSGHRMYLVEKKMTMIPWQVYWESRVQQESMRPDLAFATSLTDAAPPVYDQSLQPRQDSIHDFGADSDGDASQIDQSSQFLTLPQTMNSNFSRSELSLVSHSARASGNPGFLALPMSSEDASDRRSTGPLRKRPLTDICSMTLPRRSSSLFTPLHKLASLSSVSLSPATTMVDVESSELRERDMNVRGLKMRPSTSHVVSPTLV